MATQALYLLDQLALYLQAVATKTDVFHQLRGFVVGWWNAAVVLPVDYVAAGTLYALILAVLAVSVVNALLKQLRAWLRSPAAFLGAMWHAACVLTTPFKANYVRSIEELLEPLGVEVEAHWVETRDGYILKLLRLRRKGQVAPPGRPVLLMHGLLQTGMVYVAGGRESMGLYLLERGHDVWLGNNRGTIHSTRHVTYDPSEGKFWDFGISDLATDSAAFAKHITDLTGKSLVCVGHSQGAAQLLAALSEDAYMRSHTAAVVALAPAAFIHDFEHWPMRGLRALHQTSRALFRTLVGRKMFVNGNLEGAHLYFNIHLKVFFAGAFFTELLGWTDDNWRPAVHDAYYSETPGGTSTRVIMDWMDKARSGRFTRALKEPARRDGSWLRSAVEWALGRPGREQDYPLHHMTVPCTVLYGGKDRVVNCERLVRALPNVVCVRREEHHEHMDSLLAADASRLWALVHAQIIGEPVVDTPDRIAAAAA